MIILLAYSKLTFIIPRHINVLRLLCWLSVIPCVSAWFSIESTKINSLFQAN
jgi:hypothetical protein